MEDPIAKISARDRRQANDWALVLISQGIESTIVNSEDEAHWELIVAETDHARAVEAIRLYVDENRHWPWQRELFSPDLLFDWGAFVWLLLILLFYGIDSSRLDLRSSGIMDVVAVSRGDWWRLLTAVWLHADLGHLASNASIGIVLLGLTMGRYGTGVGLLASYLAGVIGNVLVCLLCSGPRRSLGASGLVMGCLGLIAVQSFTPQLRSPAQVKRWLGGAAGGVLLFILLGVAPDTDIVAHAGGFLGGIGVGLMCARVPGLPRMAAVNFFCASLFALLVLLPWWLALRSAVGP